MKKRLRMLFGIVFSICLLSSSALAVQGLDNFQVVNQYQNGQFTDVTSDSWYNSSVAYAYELGLMSGNSKSTFNPTGNITQAEALTIVARIHKIYTTGNDDFSAIKQEMNDLRPAILDWCYGSENNPGYKEFYSAWYSPYVYYLYTRVWPEGRAEYPQFPALAYDPIYAPFIDAQTPITRQRFVAYLFAAVPEHELQQINIVDNGGIPDVTYADSPEVYLLYRAGVMSGGDSLGTFFPNSYITRAEVSSIVTRIVDPSLRKHITLKNSQGTSDVITLSDSNITIKESTTVFIDVFCDDAVYPDGISLDASYDSNIVEIEWGDWDGWSIPLKIIPIQNGTDIIKISVNENPSEYQDIVVIVEGVTDPEDDYYEIEELVPNGDMCIYGNGHSWEKATCTTPKVCILCGITEGFALGHTVVIDEAVEATNSHTGLTEGKHCSVCKEIFVAQQIIPRQKVEEPKHSYSAADNSTVECYHGGGASGTYKTYSIFSNTVYSEYVIEKVDIQKTDSTNGKFNLTVTISVRIVQQNDGPNSVRGEWLLRSGNSMKGSGTYSKTNMVEGELYEITFTKHRLEEGDYYLTFSSVT